MLRKFLSMATAMALFAGAVAVADEKKAEGDKPERTKPISGKVKKIDAEKGILVVTTKKDKDAEEKDVEIKIDEGTTFFIPSAQGKPTRVEGKAGLKAKELKAGVTVNIASFGKGKQTVMVMTRFTGNPVGPNRGLLMGTVKKADAEKGVLVVTVKVKDEEKDREIQITDKVQVMVFAKGQKPKTIEAKAGIKDKDLFKVGAQVGFFTSPDGKTVILAGSFTGFGPMNPLNDPARGNSGKIKKVDAEKGTLLVTIDGKDVEIKPNEDTQFRVLGKVGAKPLSFKDAIKKDEFKEGAQVSIMKDKEGNVRMIVSTPSVKKPKPEE